MGGSIAAGAQAGAAFGPMGSAAGAALGFLSDMSGAGGSAGPFKGGDATMAAYGVAPDHSGWVVNMGSGSQTATTSTAKSPEAPDAYAGAHASFAGVPQKYIVPGLLAIGGLVLYMRAKRKN